METRIDINADIGEGIGNEAELMPYISSCNIACGGHAGDLETMKAVSKLAKKHGVKIGAHPSFPDMENFGRKAVEMPCIALYTSIKNQIKDLISVLDKEHLRLHHVKPHGALYNLAAVDEKIAHVIIEVMKSLMLRVRLYVPYNSVIAKLAIENQIPIMYEAFADRNYNSDLTLVSRTEANALIKDSDTMFDHVFNMISAEKVKTIAGEFANIKADTICVHGDNPDAYALISSLTKRLKSKGIQII
ncbi:5-oxoprolinase subunit PxpA [Tamlana sp. 2_MG-2023]|uniref:5-oxoprolinase subunit PxpA n=1 Tax=unclassified Tamlana TaxID=2614803 RepID=UPI0026E245AB|nr:MULTISPECIES: 5-oxoprolinase subunit PxpA [unclassified Tamlana]MDO6758858.1 5-oxoprolinase subunit PxpA [Tamlana sp. 2_MG-2023]MDO6789557.1 5-oxoprolinase subunit PxpA [Tamlana sp. 1_MG-2023]